MENRISGENMGRVELKFAELSWKIFSMQDFWNSNSAHTLIDTWKPWRDAKDTGCYFKNLQFQDTHFNQSKLIN